MNDQELINELKAADQRACGSQSEWANSQLPQRLVEEVRQLRKRHRRSTALAVAAAVLGGLGLARFSFQNLLQEGPTVAIESTSELSPVAAWQSTEAVERIKEMELMDRELVSVKQSIAGLERQKASMELELLREEVSRSFTAVEFAFPVSF